MNDCIGCMTAKSQCFCEPTNDAITMADTFQSDYLMLDTASTKTKRRSPRRRMWLLASLPANLRELEEAGQ